MIMEREEIISRIQDIARDIFEDDTLIINDTTTANDVEAWDSLTHLSLMNELEVEFKVEFTLDEISKSKCIGELVDAVLKHIA